MRRRAWGSLALLCAICAGTASAQSDEDLEHARAAFREGIELTQAQRYDEAVERFREVLEIRATAAVKYNLAVALHGGGHLAEAAQLLGEVVEDRELNARTRREAADLLASIQPRLGRLTVEVEGDPNGTMITIDGNPLDIERVGQATTVDPGDHEVVLYRGAAVISRRSVSVAEGGEEQVQLAAAVPVRDVALDEELVREQHRTPDADRPAGGGSVLEEWWFWTILAGLAVAGGAVAIGVAVASSSVSPVSGDLMPGVIGVVLP